MTPDQMANLFRAYYGAHGWIVCDRRDRWLKEHGEGSPFLKSCLPGHQSKLDGSVLIELCSNSGSVLVTANDPCGETKCCRCLMPVINIQAYLDNDMVCSTCVDQDDSEYAQGIVERERKYFDKPRR